jgi:Na+/melibiose symporter-like transporter
MAVRRAVVVNCGWICWDVGLLKQSTVAALGATYWKLAIATGIANLADGVRLVAFPWLASTLTSDPLLIAGIAAASQISWLILTVPIGVVIDRSDRRVLMLGAHTVQLCVGLLIGLLLLTGQLTVVMLIPLAVLAGCAEVVVDTTAQTLLPAVVDEQQLVRASGYLVGAETSTQALAGRPLGGLLSGLSSTLAFCGSACLAVAASFAVLLLPRQAFGRQNAAADRPTAVMAGLAQGLRWLWANRLLRDVGIIIAVSNFVYGATLATFVLFAREVLGVGAVGFAILGSCGVAGGVLGSFSAAPIAHRLGDRGTFMLVVFVTSAAFASIGLTSNVVVTAAMLALIGLLFTVWEAVWRVLRIRLVPAHLLGRVTGVLRWLEMGPFPLASVLGGALVVIGTAVGGRRFGIHLPYVLTAVVFVVLGFLLYPLANPQRVAEAEAALNPVGS